jgi:hypothetical protein
MPAGRPRKPRQHYVFALYNVKLDAFYKKKVEIRKNKNSQWTKKIKYCRLFSRKADITMAARIIASGWKPKYTEDDLRIVTIRLDVTRTDEKVHL